MSLQVLRWAALFAGIAYGFYHQSALKSQQKANETARKYHQEESLIARAKAEYLKRSLPQDKLTAGGDGTWHQLPHQSPSVDARGADDGLPVISDPNDPRFDLEAYLTMKEAGQK